MMKDQRADYQISRHGVHVLKCNVNDDNIASGSDACGARARVNGGHVECKRTFAHKSSEVLEHFWRAGIFLSTRSVHTCGSTSADNATQKCLGGSKSTARTKLSLSSMRTIASAFYFVLLLFESS